MRFLPSCAARVLHAMVVAGALAAVSAEAQTVVITQQPQSQTVLIGSNATFSVTASGVAPLNYIWFQNGNTVASGADSTYTIYTAQSFNVATYQVGVLGADGGYAVSSPFTLTVNTQAVNLIDVDFGAGTFSAKTGPAAVGQTSNDFWNFYTRDDGSGGYRNYGEVPNLKAADGTPTSALLQVYNAPGAWGNNVEDPMYGTYVYSLNPTIATTTLVLMNLPAGTFDFYIYGHEPNDATITSYEVVVDSTSQGVKSSVGPGWNTTVWHENVHYVPFRGVSVGVGQAITIYVRPGNTQTSPYGVISGLQIVQMQGQPFFPTAVLIGPTNQNLTVNSTAIISASVTGTLPLTNQWFFNSAPLSDDARISGSTTASLTIDGLQPYDTGSYWLSVSNAQGFATSGTATLNVGYVPTITNQPQTQVVTLGGAVTFNADGVGSVPLTYQWYLGSVALSDDAHRTGSTNATLSLTNVTSNDAGNYTMVLSNAYGTDISVAATLAIPVPPSVTTQPIGRSVPVGLATAFTVVASGTAPLSYQWQFNGADIPGATRTSYTVASMSAADVGSYSVVVTNAVGSTNSATALLTLGPVAGWGYNAQNQCLPPAGLSNVVALSATQFSSYALRADGSLVKWGTNPVLAANLTNLVAISMAYTDSGAALRADGTVVGINRSVPVWNNMIGVAAGPNYTYAIRADGTVVSSVLNVPVGLNHVVALAASGSQVMALRDDQTVVIFTDNGLSVINPPKPFTNVVGMACGYLSSFAAKTDGNIVAFGTNTLLTIPPAATNVANIAVSSYPGPSTPPGLAAALRRDGTIVSWGYMWTPTNVIIPASISNAAGVAIGVFHGLALVLDGSPQIVAPPIGGAAYSGCDVTLRVRATGASPLSYQWSHDGAVIAEATGSVLVLTNVQVGDIGNYQVTVTNALGSVTSVAVPVNVIDRGPFINVSQAGQTAYVGTKATLGVPISGSKPMSIQWRYHPVSNFGTYTNIPGATNDILVFNPVQASNGGSYSVVASNAFGTYASAFIPLTARQVVAWGDNVYGKTNVPVSLTNATAVSGGGYANLFALRDDGTALEWGSTGPGVTLAGFTNLVEIAAAYGGSGAPILGLRTDGTVINTATITVYSNIVASLTSILAVEVDSTGSTFLKPDGTVLRILPSGATSSANVSNVVALSQWDDGVQAVRADGTVYSYGSGGLVPVVTNVAAVASSRYTGTFLRRDQTILDWGRGTSTNSVTTGYLALACTYSGAELGVRTDGGIYAWGASSAATNVPFGLPKLRQIDGGYGGFIALCTAAQFDPVLLDTALNTTNLVVSSRNSPQWYAQHAVTHDGVSAARSAEIGRNTASSMRTLVTNGPIAVSFWWKVSSETNHDFLTLLIGGVPQAAISGEVDWQHVIVNVPAGPQMLVWTYSKDASGTAGLDAGYVDQLIIGPQPPLIYAQPQSQTVLGGSTVNFSVGADGQEPLTYRWLRATNDPFGKGPWTSEISLTNVHRFNTGNSFFVVVSNAIGTVTSSNAVLTVHTPQEFSMPLLQPDGTVLMTSRDSDGFNLSSRMSLAGFQAQYSSNLADWLPVNAPLSISNGYLQFIDTDATNDPMRFYRVIENW